MALEMEQEKRKRYDGIDLMKFICAILVVAIHAVPFEELGPWWGFEFEQVITRIAVPFFFFCSGFFFIKKMMSEGTDPENALRAAVKRLAWLYAAWCGIYFIYDFRMCLKEAGSLSGAAVLYLRDLVFLGGHFHLWYLPALMVSLLLLYVGFRLKRMGLFLGIGALLYIIGLAGNTYYGFTAGLPWLRNLYETYFVIFVTTRNGLFFGFLYVMLGGMAAWRKSTVRYRSGILLTALFLLLLHAEAYLLEWNGIPREYDLYVMTVPVTYLLFQTLFVAGTQLKKRTAEFFRNTSMGVYFIHGIFLIVYEKLSQYAEVFLTGTVYFLLVALSSVGTVWLLTRIKSPLLQSLIR